MRYLFTYEPPQPNSPSEIVVYQGLALQSDLAADPLSNWSGCHAFGPVVRTRIWKGFYSVPTPAHGLLSQLQTAETPIFKEPACARPCLAINSRIRGKTKKDFRPTAFPPSPFSYTEKNNVQSSGISILPKLPLILHLQNHFSYQTRVKLNRVFFPRRLCQARSLDCGFASA